MQGQNAFADVDNALVDRSTSLERLAAPRAQVGALGDYAGAARLPYENGYTTYIEVLDADRSSFSGQLQLTAQQGQGLSAAVGPLPGHGRRLG